MSSTPPSTTPVPAASGPPATAVAPAATAPAVDPRTAAPMIRVEHVAKRIGDKVIVEDLTFDVYQGEIFGFIGPSGSGKTSTIRLLTGVYGPTEGQIRVMGVQPDHPSRIMQEHFGYMPQLFVLYPNLTVEENLSFMAALYGMNPFTRHKRINQLLKFVELWDARHRLAEKVSGGMQRRIELAAALLHNPPLLFVDEPTAGIDPVLRSKFWDEFRRLRDEGRTIFVTTQYVGESEHCDRIGVIRKGRLIALDTPLQLRRSAFGGDMIDIEAANLTSEALDNLLRADFVTDLRPISRTQVRVSVKEAGPAVPALLEMLESANCSVTRIEEYRPSFDEVFVQLMNRDAEARGEDPNNAETP
ncbi:MAG: ATP-binding cassette domain-containing protein [Chloroflexia bacterium]